MSYLDPVDLDHPNFGEHYDELPLWSAPFGLLLLDRVPIRPGPISVARPDRVEETFEALERNLDAVAAQRGELALTIPMLCAEAARPLDRP